jgi:hypothetical protein
MSRVGSSRNRYEHRRRVRGTDQRVDERREAGEIRLGIGNRRSGIDVRRQVNVEGIENHLLVKLWQELGIRAPAVAQSRDVRIDTSRRQDVGGRDVVVQGESDMLEVVDALGATRGLAGSLDRGQKQGDQDGNDRDHDQELD